MKRWKDAALDALVSGTAASVLSTATLAACGQAELGRPFAPTNAISHWIFGDRATRVSRFSWRHTGVGYLTHQGASVFWALWYEKLFGDRRGDDSPLNALGQAAAIAALAYFVDYQLTPRRLMPGYERRLSGRALFAVYASLAAGLALGGALLRMTRRA